MKRIISVSMILSLLALFPFPAVSFADGTDDLITYEKPADAFDYSIDEDPMQITDEEFFGAWSETAQSWIQKPYFSYGKYSGLSAVEDAVKRGNYAEAKDALLEYYRSVQEERSLTPMSHPGATAVIRTQALEKNVYAVSEQNGLAQGFFNVDNDWEEHRIDVLSSFSAASVGRDAYRGFVLMSVDKHRTQAEFYLQGVSVCADAGIGGKRHGRLDPCLQGCHGARRRIRRKELRKRCGYDRPGKRRVSGFQRQYNAGVYRV